MAEPSTDPVDTVLVAYGNAEEIGRAVKVAGELGGRVVVVDNGDGNSARIAAGMGAVAIHDPSNPGFGAGQNRGVSFTGSEFVLLCNPDAAVVPGAVLAGVQLLRQRPDAAAVQGVIVNRETGLPERSGGIELTALHLLGRAIGVKRLLKVPAVAAIARRSHTLKDHVDRVPLGPVEVESLAATAVLVRRVAFESVQGFDESYFLYGEDFDLCHRLRIAGWTLLAVPGAWANHASGGSADSTWSREANWWRGTMQFGAGLWSGPAWTVALLAAVLRWARLSLRHPLHARAAYSAMVGEPRDWRGAPGRARSSQSGRHPSVGGFVRA